MSATSRKQLEDAARAAGYVPVGLTDDGTALLLEGIERPWNPRDENAHSDCMGDALRLAVKLNMQVKSDYRMESTSVSYYTPDSFDYVYGASEDHWSDPYAATRLAIVRAAAAIRAKDKA